MNVYCNGDRSLPIAVAGHIHGGEAHTGGMANERFHLTLEELEASAHVPVEDQVEEHDTAPAAPPVKADGQREREQFLRTAAL